MSKRDLFVVVADLDAEHAIRTLLCERQRALSIHCDFNPKRPPNGDLLRYNLHDAGCCRDAVALLRPMAQRYRHALLIFDRHGSGRDQDPREVIERDIEDQLSRNGWPAGAACVVVIDPELEAWVWAGSPVVARELGWNSQIEELRGFLESRGLWVANASKPDDPKEAFAQALRQKQRPRVASVFARLAKEISVRRCQDPAFLKLRTKLAEWFPA